ncbi:MAG TPA: hypothetical protein DGT21_26090 [Armatimonadetes bacterium]|jgi:hypothetical protein|nr:hypothetical protein [Armatimonadota bacterium]
MEDTTPLGTQMPRRPAVHNRVPQVLGLIVAAIFAVGVLFPTAHVVYPDAHDDAACVLMLIVEAGAALVAIVALVLFALSVCGRLLAPRPVYIRAEVPLPFSSRAPPE